MKSKLLLSFFIFISSSAILQAQISKGAHFIGGNFSISTYKADTDGADQTPKALNVNFSPAVGKVIKDNLVVGVELNIGGYNVENSPYNYQKLLTVGAGAFVRQYWEVLTKLYIFAHGRFGVAYIKDKSASGVLSTYDSKGYAIGASIYPGLSFAINKKIHLETSLNNLISANFTHRKIDYVTPTPSEYTAKINEFSLASNIFSQSGYSIGIRFFL